VRNLKKIHVTNRVTNRFVNNRVEAVKMQSVDGNGVQG